MKRTYYELNWRLVADKNQDLCVWKQDNNNCARILINMYIWQPTEMLFVTCDLPTRGLMKMTVTSSSRSEG